MAVVVGLVEIVVNIVHEANETGEPLEQVKEGFEKIVDLPQNCHLLTAKEIETVNYTIVDLDCVVAESVQAHVEVDHFSY